MTQSAEKDAPVAVPDRTTGRLLVKWRGVTMSLTRDEWEAFRFAAPEAGRLTALVHEAYRRGYSDRSEERDFDPGHALDLLDTRVVPPGVRDVSPPPPAPPR